MIRASLVPCRFARHGSLAKSPAKALRMASSAPPSAFFADPDVQDALVSEQKEVNAFAGLVCPLSLSPLVS